MKVSQTITESALAVLGALAMPGVPHLEYAEPFDDTAVVDGAREGVREDLKPSLTLSFEGGVAMGEGVKQLRIEPFEPHRLVFSLLNSFGLSGADDMIADQLEIGANYLWCPSRFSVDGANFLCVGAGVEVFDNLLGHTLADWQVDQAQYGRVIRGGNAHVTFQPMEFVFNDKWSMFYRAEFAISNNFVRLPDSMISSIDEDPRPYGWYVGLRWGVEEGVEFQATPRIGMRASISINCDRMHIEGAPQPEMIFITEGMSTPRYDFFYNGVFMFNLGFTFNPIPR